LALCSDCAGATIPFPEILLRGVGQPAQRRIDLIFELRSPTARPYLEAMDVGRAAALGLTVEREHAGGRGIRSNPACESAPLKPLGRIEVQRLDRRIVPVLARVLRQVVAYRDDAAYLHPHG